jgi:hypothetical protein
VTSSLASLTACSSLAWLLRLHLDVSIGESVKEQVSGKFFVLVAGEVSLSGFDLAETQRSEPVDGLFFLQRNQDGSGRVTSLLPAGTAFRGFLA